MPETNIVGLIRSLVPAQGKPGEVLEAMFHAALADGEPEQALGTLSNEIDGWLSQLVELDRKSIYAKGVMLVHLRSHWERYGGCFSGLSFDAWATNKFGSDIYRSWENVASKWILNLDCHKWVENIPLEKRLGIPPSKANRLTRRKIREGLSEEQADALFDENVGEHQLRALLSSRGDGDFVDGGGTRYEYEGEAGTFCAWLGTVRKEMAKIINKDDPDVRDWLEFILERTGMRSV